MSNNDFREGSTRGNKVEECLKRAAQEPSNSTDFVVRAEIKVFLQMACLLKIPMLYCAPVK